MAGNDLFDLDELRFGGKGVASNSAPTASAQASRTSGPAPLNVSFTSTAGDLDGDTLTYEWDFTSDGTVDATTANASHTYTQPGEYTATFTVSDGGRERVVTIPVTVTAPIASCPGNDDFEGTTLDTSRWSVVRPDNQYLSVSDGSLNITAQPGEDIHAGATGLRNIVLQDLPDSGPWTATTRVTWNPTLNYQNAGLVIYQDEANWIKSGMVWANGRAFEAFKELNNNASGLGAATVDASFPSTFFVRFTSDGTTVRAQRSADGETWVNTGNATNLSGLTNPKIGMYATASTNAGTQAITARFDSFTLAAPQEPSDEFEGTSLNLCRWTDIVRHEPAGYTVADGKLTLPAAHGDFFATAPNNNPNIILQPAPSGPWTMTTRVTFDPNENYEQAGLLVYGDDANYVKANIVHAGGRGLEFLREANNVAAGFGGFVSIATKPTTVELRIVSDGTTLRAYYRFEGEPWTQYGEPALLASVPNPKVGLYANDANATVTSRDDAVFDFFRLTAGVPDTTAPVTTATVAPAAGASGWNTATAVLTLATEAGATTRYKVGDGAFQDYTGPVTFDTDGVRTVTYRSVDAEGNQEADKTVTVKVDKTAPTSTAAPDGGTFTAPVQVTLSGADAADGSGLAGIEYRLDGGAWTAYADAITISGLGQHTLEHRATDVAGNVSATGTASYTIEQEPPANQAPSVTATAAPSSGSAPLSVQFTATGTDPDGDQLTYAWSYGDGQTGTGASPAHTYAAAGTFDATVTVTDEHGLSASAIVTITVGNPPGNQAPTVQATADPATGRAPLVVRFSATGHDPEGQALTYAWAFGDGGKATGATASHRYAKAGTYDAKVTVTDPHGATGTATVRVVVTKASQLPPPRP
jgi:PKD repeat protein